METKRAKKILLNVLGGALIVCVICMVSICVFGTIGIVLTCVNGAHENAITINKVIDCAMVDDLITNESEMEDHHYIKPKKKYLVCIKYHNDKYYFEGKKYYDYCKDKVSVKVEVTSYTPDETDSESNIRVTNIVMEE